MVCTLHGYYDARPKMCFTPSPPPSTPKTILSSNITFVSKCSSDQYNLPNTNYRFQDYNCNNITVTKKDNNMQRSEEVKLIAEPKIDEETTSDYIQWLHAMKLVARLPGGIPPEFRRKLWLSLADKYLKSKNVDWAKEEEKCFCLNSREDDEELGIQIVKDLHRTGSTLCTGPAGDLNQAKLKRILLGYARYNPEVGYCQGFNMLGALILQVMDKEESESIKVMIYLVEGILPAGYFCGSMGGLQADMAVFRELMQSKLPRLAKHLQKLQGPIENAYEPPLTNVFTMQWFLTMFCTCLPMSCVLRVWDLVLIEGSDVLLRTALALWSLLEERVLNARSADDFYGKMGSFSSELLNGHLIDSNGLIEKVVQLGPIEDIQKLRDKHLYNIAPIDRQQGLQLFFDDDEPDIDENSRLAVATVWGIPWGRRGSQGQANNSLAKQAIENKDRIALDISLLKKQYDRLRERQKQAQIILTSACSTASRHSAVNAPLPVNQLLSGCPAIVTNKGRRSGPPTGAVPPVRKPSLPAVLHDKPLKNQLRRGEALHWRDTKDTGNRRDSLSWKEIKAERAAMITSGSVDGLKSQKIRSNRLGKSDSSSYSDESDDNEVEGVDGGSSTDTSLCDDDLQSMTNNKTPLLYTENNQKPQNKTQYKSKKAAFKHRKYSTNLKDTGEKARPKSWAPSNTEIPFVLMITDSPSNSADENPELVKSKTTEVNDQNSILTEKIQRNLNQNENLKWKLKSFPLVSEDSVMPKTEAMSLNKFESTSKEEIAPFHDANASLNVSSEKDGDIKAFDISSEGVTNQYFERVNSTERPTRLDLLYSLNGDENVREVFGTNDEYIKSNKESQPQADYKNLDNSNNIRCIDLLVDYSEKSSAAYIDEAKTEMSTTFESNNISAAKLQKAECSGSTKGSLLKKRKGVAEKRRDPRRLTLTRSSTMDIEERFQALEKRLSLEVYSNNKRSSDEIEIDIDDGKVSQPFSGIKDNKINGAINDFLNHANSHTTLSVGNINLLERKIPSTADLEERFQSLQKQLHGDRNKTIKSPCDSENDGGHSNLGSCSGNNIKKSSNDNKNLNNGKKCDNNENHEKIKKGEILDVHSDLEEKSFAYNESKNNNKESRTEDAQTVTVQASKSTISERTPPESEKEPPDEKRAKNEENELTFPTEIEKNTKKNLKVSEKSIDRSYKNEQKSNSEMITEEEYIGETYKCSQRTSERTSPPSTEELEKRFNALEEQMCSVKTEPCQAHCKNETISEKSHKTTDNQEIKGDTFCKENVKKTPIANTESEANNSGNIVLVAREANITKCEPNTEKSNKRRLSEPPSTEDLEKRYEVLKRRMSSRNFESKPIIEDGIEVQKTNKIKENKSPTYLTKENSSVSTSNKHSPPSIENLEERYEKLQNKKEVTKETSTKSHPSTEKLEEHFEKYQKENELNSATFTETLSSKQIPKEDLKELESKTEHREVTKSAEAELSDKTIRNADPDKSSKEESRKSLDNGLSAVTAKISHGETQAAEQNETDSTDNEKVDDTAQKNKVNNILPKNDNKIKVKLIEELQAKIKEHSVNHDVDSSIEKKMALIQELKSKIDRLPETFLKPTQISSRRNPSSQTTLLSSLSFNDETLESHATSAYRRSENYEPSYSAKRKMVRRFSDLPSRADLENRLQFLEEQLSKTVCMQRRSGDSEVASKARFKNKAGLINVPTVGSLEHRTQELEKRFRENNTSLDVEFSKDTEKTEPDVEISQIDVVADTAALTGKELVRYSSNGTSRNMEHQNPINISISIQMTLNKDDIGSKKTADLSKTDDLDRRIQLLELQLKAPQVYDGHENITANVEDCVRGKNENKLLNSQLHTDGNKTSDDEIKKKYGVDYLDKISQNNQKEIKQLNNDDLAAATGNLSSLDPKNSKTSKTNIQDRELTERDLLLDECSGKVDTSCQKENPKPIEPEISDMNSTKELTSQQEPGLIEEGKGIENNLVQFQSKEDNIVEVTEPEPNSKIENTPEKSEQINLTEDKNNTNSLFQETQTLDSRVNDTQQLVQQSECPNPLPNESTEPKISDLDKKDIAEAENTSEIKKVLNSNDCSQIVPVEVNKKTLVLLLDNEPKAVKVRRLTRANTEELEDLFQALEKQLNDRGQQKFCEERKKGAPDEMRQDDARTSKEISELTKEIQSLSQSESDKAERNDKFTETKQKKQEEEFDWGSDPIKYHLKKKTVYLPSTKELEARFRSLERQIKLLEDVEKIDVEQRLIEIERKIKLQYSLSHEKDLNKFLELCEGKDPDEMPTPPEIHQGRKEYSNEVQSDQKTKRASPSRSKNTTSTRNNLEHHYRSLELKRSNSKQSFKKQPIHPLEMLLDPSPDDSDIPTTGELEHRIRVMEENRYTPSPSSQKSRSQSPPTKRNKTKPNTHNIAGITSPSERELPTAEELEARLEALEKEHSFDFKMQKNFQQFNQKLKDVVSPSLSSDEFKLSAQVCDSGQMKLQACSTPKQTKAVNAISPKTIRFCEDEYSIQKEIDTTNTIKGNRETQQTTTTNEGLSVMGIRLMRETSPLRRKGTYTGIPLRTGENINDQLTSIQNTIKSIDSLCEEKPYRRERCQQYIDALFSDSTHFARKKISVEDLTAHNLSRSTPREIGPSIRISDQDSVFSRSLGSADSIQSSSPLRSSSPLQYRSNRDLRRELSPRRRHDEDREELESRVRRDNLLPNNIYNSHSIINHSSHSSLIKFHKVDSQLIQNDVENEESLRHPAFSTIGNLIYHENANTSNEISATPHRVLNTEVIKPNQAKSQYLGGLSLPLYRTLPSSTNPPVYNPAKLEIRHTTVTSTFYDRVLTEKQLEKQHNSCSTNNQSPMVSPLLEGNVKPIYQQQAIKSPTKLLQSDKEKR